MHDTELYRQILGLEKPWFVGKVDLNVAGQQVDVFVEREVPVSVLRVILLLFRALLRDRSRLALENLALRQQRAILRRKAPRPRLRRADRVFWVSLARVWDQWRSALILVRPETVLRWHRQGYRYFWRWKSA